MISGGTRPTTAAVFIMMEMRSLRLVIRTPRRGSGLLTRANFRPPRPAPVRVCYWKGPKTRPAAIDSLSACRFSFFFFFVLSVFFPPVLCVRAHWKCQLSREKHEQRTWQKPLVPSDKSLRNNRRSNLSARAPRKGRPKYARDSRTLHALEKSPTTTWSRFSRVGRGWCVQWFTKGSERALLYATDSIGAQHDVRTVECRVPIYVAAARNSVLLTYDCAHQ